MPTRSNLFSPDAQLAGLRVLLAEDDDDAREMLADLLTPFGIVIVPARSGNEAFELFTRYTGIPNSYVSMGVHSSDLQLGTNAQLTSDLMSDLATVNHISVFATGYGPDGAHLVHYNGQGRDGLVITEPLSNPSHARLFSFTTQSF